MSNSELLKISGLSKSYNRHKKALDNVSFQVNRGQIIGLIGHNGAGKSTCLKSALGLITSEGSIKLLGKEPTSHRAKLLQEVAYIADVSVLPGWATPIQLINYMQSVHPKFNSERAYTLLKSANIPIKENVNTFSKGMIIQLHISLILSIDAKLLILDEPTLGLDVLMKNNFYQHLINRFDLNNGAIVISSHQIEELEDILTHIIILKEGRVTLNSNTRTLIERYHQLEIKKEDLDKVKNAFPTTSVYATIRGNLVMMFADIDPEKLSTLGKVCRPRLRDIIIHIMKKNDLEVKETAE